MSTTKEEGATTFTIHIPPPKGWIKNPPKKSMMERFKLWFKRKKDGQRKI